MVAGYRVVDMAYADGPHDTAAAIVARRRCRCRCRSAEIVWNAPPARPRPCRNQQDPHLARRPSGPRPPAPRSRLLVAMLGGLLQFPGGLPG